MIIRFSNKTYEVSENEMRISIEQFINDPKDNAVRKYNRRSDIGAMPYGQALEKYISTLKDTEPELYTRYIEAQKNKIKIRFQDEIRRLDIILNGIITGLNEEGDTFDIFEFYTLAPFKGKLMNDRSITEYRPLRSEFPEEFDRFSAIRKEFIDSVRAEKKAEEEKNGSEDNSDNKFIYVTDTSYSRSIYLFTKWMYGDEKAEILKQYMDANNVTNITPIGKASELGNYRITPVDKDGLTVEDSEYIFDEIERCGYAQVREVYNLLRDELIAAKKYNSSKTSRIFELEMDKKDN